MNRDCIHCMRDREAPRKYIPLDIFKHILDQAHDSGIKYVCLTGGEPTLHPYWDELIDTIVKRGFKFSIVSNGWNFKHKTLPLLLKPAIRRHLTNVCFSLDGASEKTHNTLRGEQSFQEVIEAANLCRLKRISFSIKTVVTTINEKELTDISLLGSTLGASEHSFISPFPTPRLVKENIIPAPKGIRELYSFISGSLIPAIKTKIRLEGSWGTGHSLFSCNAYQQIYSVDYLGNLIFCCNLSHVRDENKPATLGKEFLVDLKKKSLKEGIIQHYQLLARFTEDRLRDTKSPPELISNPCYWCLKYFGRLEWIKNYSTSQWVKEVFYS